MNAAAFRAPERDPEPAVPGRKRILLVDDSSTSHTWIRMILNATPHELVTARDGREGVEKARAERPDLILMDVVMPGMDGLEATRQIRAVPELRDVPVILLATRSDTRLEAAAEAGATDRITKPVDSDELLQKVRGYLQGPRGA